MITRKTIFIAVAMLITADLAFNFIFAKSPPTAANQKAAPDRAEPRAASALVRPVLTMPSLTNLTGAAADGAEMATALGSESSRPGKLKPSKLFPLPDAGDPLSPAAYLARSREALALVGTDSEAEEYWMAAINDTSLSASHRKALIEDLNEAGFADPKNPKAEELPLIMARLALIEELSPDAIDEVNSKAFDEAYKDLLAMYRHVTQ